MSDKHTQGRLVTKQDGMAGHRNTANIIESESGALIVYGQISEADARRMVACWNAFGSVPTDEVERRATPPAPITAETGDAFANIQKFGMAKLEMGHPDHYTGEFIRLSDARAAIASARTAPSNAEVNERAAIEAAAKAIYRHFPGAEAHPWVESGNSFKQDEARRYARAALAAKPAASVESSLVAKLRTLEAESDAKRKAEGTDEGSPYRERIHLGMRDAYGIAADLVSKASGRGVGEAARDGWKWVPVVPTEEMHVAAVRTIIRCTGNDDFPPRVYAAMLAVAPSPEAPAGGKDGA
jgi:hypothetical protein